MKHLSPEQIKEEIQGWVFATCPIEEKEPFFWKWNEHGLEMVATYIHDILEEERTRLLGEIEDILNSNGINVPYNGNC